MFHSKGPQDSFHARDRSRSPTKHVGDLANDLDTVEARIFVGSLVKPVRKERLEEHFSKWGRVKGVLLTKNPYGFVQFETPEEAQNCLADGRFTMLDDMRLDVKAAKMTKKPHEESHLNHFKRPGPLNNPPDKGFDSFHGRPKSPRRDELYGSYMDTYPPGREGPRFQDRPYMGDYYSPYHDKERDSGGYPYETPYSREGPRTSLEPYGADISDPLDSSRPNDIEIVVPNKLQRAYAESIEGQLKRMNLSVDLLFPPPDISPQQVLDDLTARRCLYAIFITPENEKRNSLTVNILHGETQEHRNMPVDEAMRLIDQNYSAYVKSSRLRHVRTVIPREIRNLIVDLLEMRPLSMGDLDKMIKYLKERQNSLVDDQIEQKRETAGNQPSLARSMVVSYPGYNYLTTSLPGAVPATPAAHNTVGAQPGVLAPGTAAVAAVPVPCSVGIVQAPQGPGPAYAASYAGVPAIAPQPVVGAYGIAPPIGQTAVMPSSNPVPEVQPATKQTELQERILNLMKGQGNVPAAPPGNGVPSPSAVPPPRMMAAPNWAPPSKPNDSPMKPGQAVYNPW